MRTYIIASIVILATLVGAFGYLHFKKPVATVMDRDHSVGKALIGGGFTLTDQYGTTRSDSEFRGKYMLVYFGFTSCPHICPTDMLQITNGLNALGEVAQKIVPVFITVDPARDTVPELKRFVQNFHPSFVALTGTEDEIKAVQEVYRVYSAKIEDKEINDYTMNHSALTYLMDANGEYVTHFQHGTDGDALAAGLLKEIQ